jgi:hypothetical protein
MKSVRTERRRVRRSRSERGTSFDFDALRSGRAAEFLLAA